MAEKRAEKSEKLCAAAQRFENGEGKFVVKVCDLIIIFLISFKNRF